MNKVEKKEIEKMAIILDSVNKDSQCHYDCCDNCKYYGSLDGMCFENLMGAKALYKAGYGKVEDYKKQIETDEEYEKNLNNVINKYLEKERTYKKEILRLSQDNNSLYEAERTYLLEIKKLNEQNKALIQGQIDCVNDSKVEIDKSKQQAIKEFSKKLKDKMSNREYMGVHYKQALFSDYEIDDLLKEYGIGK